MRAAKHGFNARATEPRTFDPQASDRMHAVLQRAEGRLVDARRIGVGIEEAYEIYAGVLATADQWTQSGV
jgi:hypothetical protein